MVLHEEVAPSHRGEPYQQLLSVGALRDMQAHGAGSNDLASRRDRARHAELAQELHELGAAHDDERSAPPAIRVCSYPHKRGRLPDQPHDHPLEPDSR